MLVRVTEATGAFLSVCKCVCGRRWIVLLLSWWIASQRMSEHYALALRRNELNADVHIL